MRTDARTLITLFSLALLFGCATRQPTPGAAGSHSTAAGGRHTQATVVLRITATGDGAPPSAVEVEKSSGYPMLDEAAVESVKKRTSWPSKTEHVLVNPSPPFACFAFLAGLGTEGQTFTNELSSRQLTETCARA